MPALLSQARRDAVRAHQPRPRARHVPRARRRPRDLSRPTRTTAVRVEFFGDEIEKITRIDPIRGTRLQAASIGSRSTRARIYVTPRETLERADRQHPHSSSTSASPSCTAANRLLEAQRLHAADDVRPRDDQGARLLQRHRELLAPPLRPRARRAAADADRLLPEGLSARRRRVARQTLPQVRGMCRGDRSRKETLVDYGFRLPRAIDNRPLTFDEFERTLEPGHLRLARRPARTSSSRPAARSSSRSSGRPGSSIR